MKKKNAACNDTTFFAIELLSSVSPESPLLLTNNGEGLLIITVR